MTDVLYDQFIKACGTASLTAVSLVLLKSERVTVHSCRAETDYVVTVACDGEYLPLPAADWAGMVRAVNKATKLFVTGYMRSVKLPGQSALSLVLDTAAEFGIVWTDVLANRQLLEWASEIVGERTAVYDGRLVLV